MLSGNYENLVHYYIILIHVLSGVLSLITGIVAIIANPKGGKLHRRSGILYFWCMVLIFITSILIVLFIRFNIFLTIISIFSFFMSFSGYRALKRKKPNQVKWYDRAIAFLGVLAGTGLIGYGIYILVSYHNYGFVVMCIVFGILLASNAYKDIKHFQKSEYEKLWWWFHHLTMMLTSFIAAVTAFLVNNIYKVVSLGNWNFIFWLLPTVVLVPFIVKWNKYYRKKFKMD